MEALPIFDHTHVHLEVAASNQTQTLLFFISFIGMMLFFFICSALIEKHKPSFGHETTYTILLGIAFSVILYYSTPDAAQESQTFTFKPDFFFNFFLPPIVFNSGFNMRKRMFFKNLGNIAVFGLCVTLVCFVIYGLGGYLATQIGLTSHDFRLDNMSAFGPPPFDLSSITTMQVLLYAALLCSSDVVSAVSIVDYTEQPKLFSCIFGEGVANDIVSIILFNTVEHLQSVDFVWYTPFIIIAQFFMLGIVSLSIGLFFGFLTSFIFKHASFLRVNAITETFLMFSFSMISYFASSLIKISGIEMSGIISLLTCGIV